MSVCVRACVCLCLSVCGVVVLVRGFHVLNDKGKTMTGNREREKLELYATKSLVGNAT